MRFIYTKTFAVFFVGLLFAASLSFFQFKGWLDPVAGFFLQIPRPAIKAVSAATVSVKNFFKTAYNLNKILEENGRLSEKILVLQRSLSELEQAKNESQALREELGFARNTELKLLPCNVLSANGLNLTDSIVIDCGLNQGAEIGRAVISQGYLVGKIAYAGKNTSTVLLAMSSNFLVDAKLSKSGQKALAVGSFGSGMILDKLPQNETVQKGWLAATAGINEKIPKNILIGEVGEIISSPNDLFQKATLLTPIDFKNLEFVFVVR